MSPLVATFATSGIAIVALIAAKRIELSVRRPIFPLNLISKGNIYARNVYHRAIHTYSDGKDNFFFMAEKQLPLYIKNSRNKLATYLKEKREQYTQNMRDAKLLKRSDGLSEFFKSISEVERGNGTIHESYDDGSQRE